MMDNNEEVVLAWMICLTACSFCSGTNASIMVLPVLMACSKRFLIFSSISIETAVCNISSDARMISIGSTPAKSAIWMETASTFVVAVANTDLAAFLLLPGNLYAPDIAFAIERVSTSVNSACVVLDSDVLICDVSASSNSKRSVFI